jgi:hypothetical protein
MKANKKSVVIRLRYAKPDVENRDEIVPLINLTSYSPVTKEDLFAIRFSKRVMETLLIARTQIVKLNIKSDNFTISSDLTNKVKKRSGKYIV